jgi:hypothetical protein
MGYAFTRRPFKRILKECFEVQHFAAEYDFIRLKLIIVRNNEQYKNIIKSWKYQFLNDATLQITKRLCKQKDKVACTLHLQKG